MRTITSQDGATIAFDVVGGVLGDCSQNAPLAALLAEHFTEPKEYLGARINGRTGNP